MKKLNKYKLDSEEQEIEDDYEKLVDIDNPLAFKASMEEAAKNHVRNKKLISIRVAQMDLEAMKIKATKMGIPYQSYINILIHKDARKPI